MTKYKFILQHRLYLAIILFVFSFICYLPSLKSSFVWDDSVYVKESLSSLSNFNAGASFFIPKIRSNRNEGYFGIWRPMLSLSWALDAKTWGSRPLGFHLTNNLLHSISTVLIFYLFSFMLRESKYRKEIGVSFFASLIFAVHPAHVETISFISARSDLLCSVFILLSMTFFVFSYKRLFLVLISLFFFYLALLSKETAITLPLLILSYALLRDFRNKSISIRSVILVILFFVLLILYYLIRTRMYSVIPDFAETNFNKSIQFSYDFLNYLNYIIISFAYYINKLVYPFEFNAFVGKLDYNVRNLSSAYVIALLFCSLMTISIKRKKFLMGYSLYWIMIALIPAVGVSVILLTASPFSERFLYIPSVGYCMLVSLLTFELVDFQKKPAFKYSVIVLVLAIYTIFTIREQFVWKNNTTLWGTTVSRSPGYVAPHLNYGYGLLEEGRLEEARDEFLAALDPGLEGRRVERVNAASNLGNLYMRQQEFDLAEQYFRKAYDMDKRYEATYYYHIGLLNYIRGNLEYQQDRVRADTYYAKALDNLLISSKIAPGYGRLNLLLAEVYLRLGKVNAAADYAAKSLHSNKRGMLDEQMMKRAKEVIQLKR